MPKRHFVQSTNSDTICSKHVKVDVHKDINEKSTNCLKRDISLYNSHSSSTCTANSSIAEQTHYLTTSTAILNRVKQTRVSTSSVKTTSDLSLDMPGSSSLSQAKSSSNEEISPNKNEALSLTTSTVASHSTAANEVSQPVNKSNIPKLTTKEASPSKVTDVSDTFIRIETKDGLSTERIPFMQFLQKMVINTSLDGMEVNLSQLLKSHGEKVVVSDKTNKHVAQSDDAAINVVSTNSKTPEHRYSCQKEVSLNVQSERKHPRRGRPPKNKLAQTQISDESDKREHLFKIDKDTVKESNKAAFGVDDSSESVDRSVFPVSVSKTPTALRRSRRTLARNTRFGDDFVDSVTLGKVSSTPWNTQLMTLALAAERHETKPHSCRSGEEKGDAPSVMSVSENGSVRKDSRSTKENTAVCTSAQRSVKGPLCHTNIVVKQNLKKTVTPSSEQMRVCDVASLKGPKTLKKYEPVSPVVRLSLPDALRHALATSKEHLHSNIVATQVKDGCLTYYTVMEPKLIPSGSGLMVHKTINGVEFQNAVLSGNLPAGVLSNTDDNSYPQDRFFSCDLCDAVFISFSSWLQHNSNVHQRTVDNFEGMNKSATYEKGEFKCGACNQSFPYQFMLTIHVKRRRHNQNKSFRCTVCRQSFCSQREREEHWMLVHPARNCGLCGKQFSNIVMLRRHINNNCHGARFRRRLNLECVNAASNMATSYKACELIKTDDSKCTKSNSRQVESMSNVEFGNNEDQSGDVDIRQIEENRSPSHTVVMTEQLNVKTKQVKASCETCGAEFSTHSGLWYHKLETHHAITAFNYQLRQRLEKNETSLRNVPAMDNKILDNKSKFYIIMQPKWLRTHEQLSVSVSEKEFSFKSIEKGQDAEEVIDATPSTGDGPGVKKDILFQCSQCYEVFNFASNYRDHRSCVHGECFETVRLLGAFQCIHCSDTFPCQFMLDAHTKRHTGKRLLPCTLCGVTFHKIQERRQHWKTAHPGIGCPNCGKMYASIKYLQKHISLNCQDHFPPTKKFLQFRKNQHNDFEMEKKDKRVEKKILRCHLCPKISSSIHGWRRHMSKYHEAAGFSKLSNTCIICNQLVYGYKALEKHLLQVHAEDSGLPVDEENDMIEEALKKSTMDITTYRKAGRNNSDICQDDAGNYQCPSCAKTHVELSAMRTHIKTHVNMGLECSVCHKSFKNPILLKQHVQRHRKDAVYSCEICNKSFLTLQKLNKHRKVHHRDQRFTCELCGMTFAQNDYLQKHLRCHTNKRPHICTVCSKTFRTKPELRVHILIHTRETPYKCQFCGRGFSQKGNYRIHLAQHTGEKPYQCDQCNISFALLCHLKRHKANHDQKIHFRCIWCGKECTQRKHILMHVQRVHKEDFSQYEEEMRLETPVPIAPSQMKMYNRKLGKPNKVRRAYRTRAQKCDSSIQELMDGVVPKTELVEEDDQLHMASVGPSMVVESLVEPMMETVSIVSAEPASEVENFEVLVSNDHENYVKPPQSSTVAAVSQLLSQPDVSSQLEIVMGANNEISIIIKDPSALQDIVGVAGQALDPASAQALHKVLHREPITQQHEVVLQVQDVLHQHGQDIGRQQDMLQQDIVQQTDVLQHQKVLQEGDMILHRDDLHEEEVLVIHGDMMPDLMSPEVVSVVVSDQLYQ